MNTMYTIYEQIGNFADVVARFDNWYEVQDYLSDRLDAAGIDPDDDSAVQLFYSYFDVQSVQSDYDYEEAVTADICDYIRENVSIDDYSDIDELRESLYDELFISDSVTGNASGSYTFNRYTAERNLCGNLSLLAEAIEEFCDTENSFKYLSDPERADVTIRCYLLSQCLDAALDEMDIESEFDAREEISDIELVNAQ